jgi:hypothetical protein
LELKLPAPLVELANRPHGRYRLSCLIRFAHRGDEWAAQAASGAVRYDIIFHPNKRRWYLDASWRRLSVQSMTVRAAVAGGVVAVDLNAAHMDCFVVDRHGNPSGPPTTIPLELDELPSSTRDGRLRAAIVKVLDLAGGAGYRTIAVEALDFADARAVGPETMGRGWRGRRFRRTVADQAVPGSAGADGVQPGACGGGRGSRLDVGVGWPLLAAATPAALSEHEGDSASCGQRGAGQTRAWPWGPAAARHARR